MKTNISFSRLFFLTSILAAFISSLACESSVERVSICPECKTCDSPLSCHTPADTVSAAVVPGDDESIWHFKVLAKRCLAAICVLPHEDESTLVHPPRLLHPNGQEIGLVQVLDEEGTGLNEWCAQWRELRHFTDLGGEETKLITLTGRSYKPTVNLSY